MKPFVGTMMAVLGFVTVVAAQPQKDLQPRRNGRSTGILRYDRDDARRPLRSVLRLPRVSNVAATHSGRLLRVLFLR